MCVCARVQGGGGVPPMITDGQLQIHVIIIFVLWTNFTTLVIGLLFFGVPCYLKKGKYSLDVASLSLSHILRAGNRTGWEGKKGHTLQKEGLTSAWAGQTYLVRAFKLASIFLCRMHSRVRAEPISRVAPATYTKMVCSKKMWQKNVWFLSGSVKDSNVLFFIKKSYPISRSL